MSFMTIGRANRYGMKYSFFNDKTGIVFNTNKRYGRRSRHIKSQMKRLGKGKFFL